MGKKPLPAAYPRQLCTIGDHIRKRRLDLSLLQKDVALLIGASPESVRNWELNHREPALRFIPGIIGFLSHVPFPPGESLPERLRAYRKIRGLSRKKLACLLGVDESTLWRWERGERPPREEYARRIQSLLGG